MNVNRHGIFVFYDEQGVVDNYVLFLLREIRKCVSSLSVVINGNITDTGYEKLKNLSTKIYKRNNVGFDIGAYKNCILDLDGTDYISNFDELLLFNDTFYGPFYSLENSFNKMSENACDFWGISKHNKCFDLKEIDEFIQSYFVVFKKKMIHSRIFYKFWESIPDNMSYVDCVRKFEQKYTAFFNKKGFKHSALVCTDDLFSTSSNSICYNTFIPDIMTSKYNLPILRKKCFPFKSEDVLRNTNGENLSRCMKYIKEKTNYDINLIWENVLRLYNIYDIWKNCHLNYIFSNNSNYLTSKSVAVIAHLYYNDLFDYSLGILKNIPKEFDIYITTNCAKKANILNSKIKSFHFFNNIKIIIVGNRGRDIAALFVGCKNVIKKYDYLCFTHDKKTAGSMGPASVGKSFMDLIMKNVLSSEGYIRNVVQEFDKDKRLGVLSVPPPLFWQYFCSIGQEWTNNFENTRILMKKMNINVNLSEKKPPLTLGTSFWCKTAALKNIVEYDLKYSDFPEEPLPVDGSISHSIERMIGYSAQANGYYTGIVYDTEYSSLEIANLKFMLSKILQIKQGKYIEPVKHFNSFIEKIETERFEKKRFVFKFIILPFRKNRVLFLIKKQFAKAFPHLFIWLKKNIKK